MFWTTGLVIVALLLSQVPAGLAKPGIFVEEEIIEESSDSERIISGWEAYPGQFPYVAALRIMHSNGQGTNCMGSVVHRDWVLTSGGCIHSRVSVIVRAGITDLTAIPEYIFETTEWWVHPEFTTPLNNIAIIKLQQSLPYNKLVQPIRIQPWADAFNDYDNEVVIASGWGMLSNSTLTTPDVLNWVYLRAISNEECSGNQSTLNSHYICTRGYNVTSQSTCNGDDGGPLAHVGRDGEPVLVGITVRVTGFNCGNFGNPAAFVRPGPYQKWLTVVTGINFDEAAEPPTTEATEPPTTEAPKPPTTEVSILPTTESPKPSTTEVLKPSSTEATKPPTTESPKPPATEVTKPPTTKAPKPVSSEESDDNSNDSDSSESKEDPIVSKNGNKLVKNQLKIKVSNNVNVK